MFSNHFNFPRLNLSNLFQPKSLFYLNPFIFKQELCKISSRYVFITLFFSFFLDYADFCLGFWQLGIFENWVGFLIFVIFFFLISRLGLVPFDVLCICAGPMWQFELVLRHFSSCSCIVHSWYFVLHAKCLTKCSSDIFVIFDSNVFVWTCSTCFSQCMSVL